MAAKRKTLPAKSKVKSKLKVKKPARRTARAPAKKKPSRSGRAKARPAAADPRQAALQWFSNLSARIQDASVAELQALIAEARTYDLVGLEQMLGDHAQVLSLNRAANELIEAGMEAFGAASPVGFQLQVLRDILNDS